MAFIAEQQKRELESLRDEKTATPPTASKRQKKGCPFALEKRRAENGATHVQMIRDIIRPVRRPRRGNSSHWSAGSKVYENFRPDRRLKSLCPSRHAWQQIGELVMGLQPGALDLG